MEEELDSILASFDEKQLAALENEGYSKLLPHGESSSNPLQPNPPSTCTSARFSLTTDKQLGEAKMKSVCKNTAWAVNIWKEWSKYRQSQHPGRLQGVACTSLYC